ncbi:uncharacterized protein LOC131971036 isoform X1 [Centropristis striata]|uniref:uncharacterized protein LOC131971036 isoform X1 n=1 Tax=Centropristis striata TaxID=184440 RepID=UPI0027E0B4CC|nr:uncharacterized protein LOC131971036 isoform X1 [Centropristis striata]
MEAAPRSDTGSQVNLITTGGRRIVQQQISAPLEDGGTGSVTRSFHSSATVHLSASLMKVKTIRRILPVPAVIEGILKQKLKDQKLKDLKLKDLKLKDQKLKDLKLKDQKLKDLKLKDQKLPSESLCDV